jgi:methylmalonyl-CoA mutase
MEQLFENFHKVSKVEWFAKIKTDLKGHNMEAFEKKYDCNISISPFLNIEDKKSIQLPLIYDKNKWLIAEKIEPNDPIIVNKLSKIALEGGANALNISINFNWEKADFEVAFSGIYLEYVYVNFEFENDNNIENFFIKYKEYLIEKKQKIAKINGGLTTYNLLEQKAKNYLIAEFENYKFIEITGKKNNSISIQLSDILIDAELILHQNNIDLCKNMAFEIEITPNFYLNIASIRALKILLANVMKTYGFDLNIFLKVKINCNEISDKNTSIIAATNQALSAIIGGADYLEIAPFNFNDSIFGEGFATRIARNIQNIILLESFNEFVKDAAAGSYYIDSLTETICKETWTLFKSKITK